MRNLGFLSLLAGLLALAPPAPAQQVLSGRVFTADGDTPAGVWVFARSDAGVDSARVEADGSFSLRFRAGRAGTLDLFTDEATPARRRYHPALVRLRAAGITDQARLVLVPLRWTIRQGTHAGTPVEISMQRAFAPVCRGCSSFFRLSDPQPPSRQAWPMATWPSQVFPIRLAFSREATQVRVLPRDSLAFWRVVGELEREFGRDLFRPAAYEETLDADGGVPEDVVLVEWDPRLRRVGWGSTYSQVGDIFYGAMRVRGPDVFTDQGATRIIKHELLHTLGLGHTCGWESVLSETTQCSSRNSDRATPEDVAYFEVLTEVRDLQRALRAQFGLEAALHGEREIGRAR